MAKKAPKPAQQNVDELLRFVEALKHRWMSTIDSLVDPLMIVGKDFTISKANLAMAKTTGLEIKELLGRKCYEVFAQRKTPCTGCKMKTAAKNSTPEHFELDAVSDRFYEVSSQPIYDRDNNLDGIVQVYRDRTEAKQLQAQLLQSEKLASIGLLAGGIAHEINNPLGGILVFSQMLQREMPKDSVHRPDVDEIYEATLRCKAIVENLLDFARTRPAQNKNSTLPEVVDVNDAAVNALRFGKVGVMATNVQITESWHPEPLPVHVERNRLIQIFLNLIQNGLQAMPEGGSLNLESYIESKGRKKLAVIEISDSGIGIPEAYQKKIFDPFFTTKDPGEGTGLGLAICYGIIQDAGGELSVKSTINEGTTFKVTLPLASEKEVSTAS